MLRPGSVKHLNIAKLLICDTQSCDMAKQALPVVDCCASFQVVWVATTHIICPDLHTLGFCIRAMAEDGSLIPDFILDGLLPKLLA